MHRTVLTTLCLALCAPGAAAAQNRQTFWGSPRIDPHAEMLFGHRARFGRTLGVYRPSPRFEREGVIPVLVRFTDAPGQRTLAALAARGVRFAREGRPLASGAYAALVDERALRALEADALVGRVEVDLPLAAPLPLDAAARETAVDAARRAVRVADGVELDGRGTVIADIDTSIFVFHPALFHADAGAYPWLDVDGDGRFTPGTDAVDLDRDGVAAPGEVLRVLHATTVDRLGRPIGPEPTQFRPDRDWVYVDANDNGARDYGAGFDETTPAYGEPIFVADDADRDGALDPTERLLRLGTSKVRAVLSDVEYRRGPDQTFPLIQYDLGDDAEAFERAGHATGVGGILVGGVPGVSRWVGLAPAADLLVGDYYGLGGRMGTAGAVQWAIDQGAHVILTEYAPYANVTLDGSSEEEMLLDAAAQQGSVPVSPAGNLAASFKHRSVRLLPGETQLAARTDRLFQGARLAQFSLHHRGRGRAVAVAVELPDGRRVEVPASTRGTDVGSGLVVYSISRTSARGTEERHVVLYRPSGLPEGGYTFVLTLSGTTGLDAEVYLGDDRSSWGGGLTFAQNDSFTTLCHPSTSDRTLSVAAYVLHTGAGFMPDGMRGERAGYSSQGPRIDGDPGIEIIAPDNPMSLAPVLTGRVPYGALSPFGGTSGAGPHVAAAAALLRQRFPAESAEALRARLLDNARLDEQARADTPTLTGNGKLDLAAAAGLSTLEAGTAPTVQMRAPAEAMVGASAQVDLEVTDDGPRSELRVRWDLDYDGRTDTDWIPLGPQNIPTPDLGVVAVRAEVRDAQGNLAAATGRIDVVRQVRIVPDAGSDGGMTPGGGGCGCTVPGRPKTHGPWPLVAAAGLAALWGRGRRRRTVGREAQP